MRGYIALTTVLIISFLILTIGITSALLSVNQAQVSLGGKKSYDTIDLIEACIEDALLKLSRSGSLPANILLPDGSCSLVLNSNIGQVWDFTVELTYESYTKKIRVNADRGTSITINSWVEVE